MTNIFYFFQIKFIKFLLIGLLNTLFGYSIYAFFIYLNLDYYSASILSYIFGILFNFFTYKSLVFNIFFKKLIFIKFLIVYVLIYLLNLILLKSIDSVLNNLYTSQAVILPFLIISNWLLFNLWVFKK